MCEDYSLDWSYAGYFGNIPNHLLLRPQDPLRATANRCKRDPAHRESRNLLLQYQGPSEQLLVTNRASLRTTSQRLSKFAIAPARSTECLQYKFLKTKTYRVSFLHERVDKYLEQFACVVDCPCVFSNYPN